MMVRADSGYYRRDLITAALRAKAWFSVTVRMNSAVVRAIAGIRETAWTTIKYPKSIWDEDEKRWISEAQVAETEFTAFTSARKDQQVPCRLVVRRVQRLNKVAVAAGQDELFASWRHHGFVTNSRLTTVAADETHRDHAIVEQVIAELKSGALAHAPSVILSVRLGQDADLQVCVVDGVVEAAPGGPCSAGSNKFGGRLPGRVAA